MNKDIMDEMDAIKGEHPVGFNKKKYETTTGNDETNPIIVPKSESKYNKFYSKYECRIRLHLER